MCIVQRVVNVDGGIESSAPTKEIDGLILTLRVKFLND